VKRYFVSPEESGEICLLACVLGQSGDIFFPRLDEEQMMTFSQIAIDFLRVQGYEPHICATEEEARTFVIPAKAGTPSSPHQPYPVYFFTSDTSGEKSYEEFFTEGEDIDLESFESLGVIKNAPRKPIGEVKEVIGLLEKTLQQPGITKPEIVSVLSKLIPGFDHIETGKGLDSKM
jgi:FlaA1/EpsC-like NDP-sugar epimerase